MPWLNIPPSFKDAAGARISAHEAIIEEPVSGETIGAVLTAYYTPRGLPNEQYVASIIRGPLNHVRVEMNIDGAGWLVATTPVAAGPVGVVQVIQVRPVALVHSGADIKEVVAVVSVESGSAASWLA